MAMVSIEQFLSGETLWVNTKAEREELGKELDYDLEAAHEAYTKAIQAERVVYFDKIREAFSNLPSGKALDVFVAKTGGVGHKLVDAAKLVKKPKADKPAASFSGFAALRSAAATAALKFAPPVEGSASKPVCKPGKK